MHTFPKPTGTRICIIRLTEVGLAEAAAAGRRLAQAGFAFDEVHGSVLQRTRQTVKALLAAMGRPEGGAAIHDLAPQ